MLKKKTEDEAGKIRYEKCVCCKKLTGVPVNQEIAYRSFYIEGAGQLCYDCYMELYK